MTPEEWRRARDVLDWRTIQNNKRNTIQVNRNESYAHFIKKVHVCRKLVEEGKTFITEAIFKNGLGRADIFVIEDFLAIEIVHTEDIAKSGKEKYPCPIEFIRT